MRSQHFSKWELARIVKALKIVRDHEPKGFIANCGGPRNIHNTLIDARNCGLVERITNPLAVKYRRTAWHLTVKGAQVLKAIESEEEANKA